MPSLNDSFLMVIFVHIFILNFISHFHYDRNHNPYHDVGLVLPDLVRSFTKKHLTLNLIEDYNEQETQLLLGCQKHFQIDALFHQSYFFTSSVQSISNAIGYNATWPRKFFLNHVLVEILLDRVLLDNNSKLCDEFYLQLKTVDLELLSEFLRKNNVENTDHFIQSYLKFIQISFIYDYLDNKKIITALSQLYKKVGIDYQFTEHNKHFFDENLPKLIEMIKKNEIKLTKELYINEEN